MSWKTIDSAPADTEILAYWDGAGPVLVSRYAVAMKKWHSWYTEGGPVIAPKLWQPLPPPPDTEFFGAP